MHLADRLCVGGEPRPYSGGLVSDLLAGQRVLQLLGVLLVLVLRLVLLLVLRVLMHRPERAHRRRRVNLSRGQQLVGHRRGVALQHTRRALHCKQVVSCVAAAELDLESGAV